MCGPPPLSPTGAGKTFCHGLAVENAGDPRSEGCVRGSWMSFFFEMLASTKSFSCPDEKIVRFLGGTLFLLGNRAFSALERNMHHFLPIFEDHGGRPAGGARGYYPLPRANPAPQPPQNDVFGSATSKNIILGRLGGGVSSGEGVAPSGTASWPSPRGPRK